MDLILLGDNKADGKQWIEDIADTFANHQDSVHIHQYEHWGDEEAMDMDTEMSKLSALTEDCDDTYAILAKSTGVILALDAIRSHTISPQRCVFVGAPIGASAAERLGQYRIPTLFIQHANDSVRPAQKLRNVLENHNLQEYAFKEIPEKHDMYRDIVHIARLAREFLAVT